MRQRKPTGVVAAGHPLTAEAAGQILEDGGNAFDAVVAAAWMACVGEPVLTSVGGGGFMMARDSDGHRMLFDFFTQTPRRRPLADLDFFPIEADFGPATQEFHIGRGAVATPGMVAGLFDIQRRLGSLPMTRLVEPAVHWARQGSEMNPLQAYIFNVVRPIYAYSAESRALFGSRRGDGMLQAGEQFRNPQLADLLEVLAIEGEALFYRGEVAAMIVAQSREGGHLSADDLESYQVELRAPLEARFGDARLLFNPPPSSDGPLIAFSLALWRASLSQASDRARWGSADSLLRLARIIAATNEVRERHYDPLLFEPGIAQSLLSEQRIDQALKSLRGESVHSRGTSHISVMDGRGNIAALTSSNGEGCGYLLPGTGIMLNNMLGEEDVNPHGFQQWRENRRLSSMMSPTVVEHRDYSIATGSGGSNRIRSAVLQVLLKLIDYRWKVEPAVNSPRLHVEGRQLSVEPGFEPGALQALEDAFPGVDQWDRQNLFFGGAHSTVHQHREDRFSGAGDQRRGGVCVLL